jgi:hypothetical protein
MTVHLVQYSTGIASAEIAWRLTDVYGPGHVVLLTADVRKEDPDNWRFAHEVADRLGCPWTILSDGRTPMQAGRDERCVPNNRMAVCSKLLKRELLRQWIDQHYGPADTIIYEGYDWTEQDRIDAARPRWQPYQLATPLAEPPYTSKPGLLAAFRDRGIEPPRLYAQGFHHANCGGACVRGGQAQWALLLRVNRPRYAEWEADEESTRLLLGKDVSILKETVRRETRPLTLRRFRERLDAQGDLFDPDDWGACGCDPSPAGVS